MTKLRDIAATPIAEIARRDPVRVPPTADLGEVAARLREHGRGAVVVEDESGIIGIFSERDMMKRVDHGDRSWRGMPVREVMTASPKTISGQQTIADAINLMLAGKYRHLPIVDEAAGLVGIVSIRDLLAHIVDFFPKEFVNLPLDPDHEASGPWGG